MDKELLLYNYFSNQLTNEQEKQFNELLENDVDFKAQFDFEKNLQNVIRDSEVNGLKDKLVGFENEIVNTTPVRKMPPNISKWTMAASVALLAVLSWIGYSNFSGPNYGDLYNANFKQYPNTVYAITRGESVASIERDAFTAYEVGNYQTAITNFNKIPAASREAYLDFYVGQSYLNLEQLDQAKISFERCVSAKSQFIAEAHWYLALIAIKEKDRANAIQQLTTLTSKFEYNKDKALAILEKLE